MICPDSALQFYIATQLFRAVLWFCCLISPSFKRCLRVKQEMHNIGVAAFNAAKFKKE